MSEDVGTTVGSAVGPAGGVIETTQDGVTYRLEVPPGALDVETELTLTPARLIGIDGAVGARLEPDGTTFLAPAVLRIAPAPDGDVLVALQDGPFPVEASLAIRAADAVLLPVAHFSTHNAAAAQAALAALPADVRAEVQSLAGRGEDAIAAIGLGAFFRAHVEPLLPLSSRDVHGFEIASEAVLAWLAAMELVDSDLSFPHEDGGTESLETLRDLVVSTLVGGGRELLARITEPSCTASPDIVNVFDWALVPTRLATALSALDTAVTANTCLKSKISVVGQPTSLSPDTAEIHLSLLFEVVAPQGDGRTARSDASFTLEAVGATGPANIQDGNGGDVRDVVFVRTLGPDRPRAVSIRVQAISADGTLGRIPEPDVEFFTATEPGTDLTVTATPALLERPSETAQVCTTVRLDGQTVDAFTVRYELNGVGALSATEHLTTTGSACVTYTPPSPLPEEGGSATVSAAVDIGGGQLRGRTEIQLGQGGIELVLTSTPSAATTAGESLSVCATVTTGGSPVPSYQVQYALGGPGQLAETGVINAVTTDGESCTTWVAPTPLVAGQVANISAHASTGAFSADATLAIPLGPQPPTVVVAASPDTLDTPSDVAQVCVTATEPGGAPLSFTASFDPPNLGSVAPSSSIVSVAGQACTTYTAPSVLPAIQTDVVFNASIDTGSVTATGTGQLSLLPPCGGAPPAGCAAGGHPDTRLCNVNDPACFQQYECTCGLSGCRTDGGFATPDPDVFEYICRSD